MHYSFDLYYSLETKYGYLLFFVVKETEVSLKVNDFK